MYWWRHSELKSLKMENFKIWKPVIVIVYIICYVSEFIRHCERLERDVVQAAISTAVSFFCSLPSIIVISIAVGKVYNVCVYVRKLVALEPDTLNTGGGEEPGKRFVHLTKMS